MCRPSVFRRADRAAEPTRPPPIGDRVDDEIDVALVVATTKTSTLEKEVSEVTAAGYQFVGMTVADTAIGGSELVSILRKRITP